MDPQLEKKEKKSRKIEENREKERPERCKGGIIIIAA
jgi:hypothetical protein